MTEIRDAIRALAHEDFTKARDLLAAIVAEQPSWADAWALLSGAHLALAEADLASSASERALELAPDGFLPRMKAGELALRLGHLEVAETQLLAAVRATEPHTADAAAAGKALAIARRGNRTGIVHRAALPRSDILASGLARPFRLGRSLVRRVRRPPVAPEAI
jgi:predicted Zn-dependent protease